MMEDMGLPRNTKWTGYQAHQGNYHGYTKAIKELLDKIVLNQSVDRITSQVNEVKLIIKKGLSDGYPIRSLDMTPQGGEHWKCKSL